MYQNKRPIHPSKVVIVKDEIEKLCTTGFIYPIAYIKWVSNPIPKNKKQGTNCICIDFLDLNWVCPKDNLPTPFIHQIINVCTKHDVFSFMDIFFGYNQIQIWEEDHYKTTFTTPWGTFAYRVMPFGLKNVGATFQHDVIHCFCDLIHIMLVYLDNLIAWS